MTRYHCTCTPDSPYQCAHCEALQDYAWEKANERDPAVAEWETALAESRYEDYIYEQLGPAQ